jgi:hypothetical protein
MDPMCGGRAGLGSNALRMVHKHLLSTRYCVYSPRAIELLTIDELAAAQADCAVIFLLWIKIRLILEFIQGAQHGEPRR